MARLTPGRAMVPFPTNPKKSLPRQEAMWREMIDCYVECFARGLGEGKVHVLEGLNAAAEFLLGVGLAWRELEAEWEEHHDLLILGVGL